MTDLGAEYRKAAQRIAALVSGLGPDELARTVPATPRWTVRELVCHLTGVAGDVVSGNMAGAPGDDWAAAQVAARCDRPIADVLEEWSGYGEPLTPLFTAGGMPAFILVADVVSHEHDVRGAVGAPGHRDEPVVGTLARGFVTGLGRRLDEQGVARLRIVVGDREHVAGSGEPAATVEVGTYFELLRGLAGRRTEAELRAWRWDGDADPYLPHLSVFPLPEASLGE